MVRKTLQRLLIDFRDDSSVDAARKNADMLIPDSYESILASRLALVGEYKSRTHEHGIIYRLFGHDLSLGSLIDGGPIKVLHIGCGPDRLWTDGPKVSMELEDSGAHVTNLDILDVSEHYTNFVQGSWLELDKYFENQSFDVIFTSNMTPLRLRPAMRSFYDKDDVESSELLVKKTFDFIHPEGIFYVAEAYISNFKIPGECILSEFSRYHYEPNVGCMPGTFQLFARK